MKRFVESVSSKLAFFPPQPPCYTVKEHADGSGELYLEPTDRRGVYAKVAAAKVERIPTVRLKREGGGGTQIVTAFIPFKEAGKQAQATMLYSHGNAVDLGQMLPVMRDLGKVLKCNMMAYDYSGYGECTGEPSPSNTLADISAVFQHMQKQYGVQPENTILYGQSVGSGPTVWLAAHTPGLAGVVLHSPLLSGMRVLSPGMKFWPSFMDIFPNHLLMPRVDAPVLVIHGTMDEVIDVTAGKRLVELAKRPVQPLWAENFGHQNLEACPQFVPALKAFLATCLPGAYKPSSRSSGGGPGSWPAAPSAASAAARGAAGSRRATAEEQAAGDQIAQEASGQDRGPPHL